MAFLKSHQTFGIPTLLPEINWKKPRPRPAEESSSYSSCNSGFRRCSRAMIETEQGPYQPWVLPHHLAISITSSFHKCVGKSGTATRTV